VPLKKRKLNKVFLAMVNISPCFSSLSQLFFPLSPPPSLVREKYRVDHSELGHGHYGVVRKCQNRQTKDYFAVKTIKKSKVGRLETLKREIEILKTMDHPNIIKLVDVFEDDKYLHLVTELCTGGEVRLSRSLSLALRVCLSRLLTRVSLTALAVRSHHREDQECRGSLFRTRRRHHHQVCAECSRVLPHRPQHLPS
jgi:hypothetical protein